MIEDPKQLRKSESRIKKPQRDLSRKEKGSKNRGKARLKVAKLHNEGCRIIEALENGEIIEDEYKAFLKYSRINQYYSNSKDYNENKKKRIKSIESKRKSLH